MEFSKLIEDLIDVNTIRREQFRDDLLMKLRSMLEGKEVILEGKKKEKMNRFLHCFY